MPDLGYYTLPVIASFEGIDAQVNKQLGAKFGVAGKKASKDFSKGLGDGLKTDLDQAGASYKKLQDKASDALGKIRAEEAKLQALRDKGASADRIVVAEERLATARRNSVRATADAQSGLRDFERAQKDASDGAGRAATAFANVGSKATALGAAAGAAAIGGIALLAAGAVTATRQLYDLGAQFDDLSDTLQVKTGLSGAALDKLQASVERLGTTNVPSTFAEIGDVAAEVTRNLHLTGPELEAVTSRLANLARMGQNVDIRSLGKVFRGFGVEAKDQAPALNSLYEASTQTGLSIDDLTASLAKGGAPLRQLGLDFGASAALMTSLEAAGLDGEKGVLALNKAFAYFSKEGIPAERGLQQIITRIQELGDTPQAGELATKVFGAKGGAAFLEAIQQGDIDLQSLSGSLQSTGIDINTVSQNTADWSERWQDLKNDVSVALEPLANRVFDGINAQLGELADWVNTHQDELIDFFVLLGDAAIGFAERSAMAVGTTLQVFGDLAGGLGNIVGASLRADAALQRLVGRGEYADQLDGEADAAFGWGEKYSDAGDKIIASIPGIGKARDAIHDIGEEAKKSTEKFGWWATSVDGVKTSLGNLPTPPPGLTGNTGTQPGWLPGMTNVPSIAPPDPSDGSTAGHGFGGPGINMFGSPGPFGGGNPPRKVGSDLNLTPDTIAVKDQISSQFAAINDIGGWRANDPFPDHPSGQAIDVMIPNALTPGGKNLGDQVTAAALQNPGVDYVMWQATVWHPDGTSSPQNDKNGDITHDHFDHVHVHTRKPRGAGSTAAEPGALTGAHTSAGGGLPGSLYQGDSGSWHSMLPGWDHLIQRESKGINQLQGITDMNSGGNEAEGLFQITPQTWAANGGLKFAPRPLQASPQEQATIAAAIFAADPSGGDWGAGLPGRENPTQLMSELQGAGPSNPTMALSGTTGYNEDGELGSYVPDPKKIREAEERKLDADERIRQADASAAQAKARRDELAVDATDTERQDAEESVRQAEYNAQKARREAADAATDLAETQKGDFKKAKESKTGTSGKGGTSQFGELGSIAGSFLKETFGLDGSLFPDISNLGIVQSAGALMGAFKGPLQWLIDGMPPAPAGWVPGSGPVPGAVPPTMTSGSPFGMQATSMPAGIPGVSSGVGTGPLPGPGGIDNSVTINNPQGEPTEKSIQRANMSRPRIDSYAIPGT